MARVREVEKQVYFGDGRLNEVIRIAAVEKEELKEANREAYLENVRLKEV